ncbi:hypothetical protein B484DRAFT_399723 [Ochromonadaceae sp. CCMP2298]|nr:hypothetical protein B484DRAFT_399723 [Ochromonadaceae sp. CCMP2298]
MRSWLLLCVLAQAHSYAGSGTQGTRFKKIEVIDLSQTLVPYETAWDWQQRLAEKHIALQDDPTQTQGTQGAQLVGSLLMLQHPPVYTLGSGTNPSSGPFGNTDASGAALPFETVVVNRAGEATYHGPGQVVLYPILDLPVTV